jgi:hypothetical protein
MKIEKNTALHRQWNNLDISIFYLLKNTYPTSIKTSKNITFGISFELDLSKLLRLSVSELLIFSTAPDIIEENL